MQSYNENTDNKFQSYGENPNDRLQADTEIMSILNAWSQTDNAVSYMDYRQAGPCYAMPVRVKHQAWLPTLLSQVEVIAVSAIPLILSSVLVFTM